MSETVTPEPGTSRAPALTKLRFSRRRFVLAVSGAVVLAGGLGVGITTALSGATANSGASSAHAYPQSMMGRWGPGWGAGGNGGWMMGPSEYGRMMGGASAPGWMNGGTLPGYMMGSGSDPGKVMGSLFANAPGPRISPADASRLGSQVPDGATADPADHRLTFATTSVRLVMLASPAGGPDETFRIAGMVNPTILVPTGASVSVELVNTDSDTAHGLVVSGSGAASSWMPMMTSNVAFPGAALWFLGNPTSAGMHVGTVSFTASHPGTYTYLCPVPEHAQKGMLGSFVVGEG